VRSTASVSTEVTEGILSNLAQPHVIPQLTESAILVADMRGNAVRTVRQQSASRSARGVEQLNTR
jgi:hypothetical protein